MKFGCCTGAENYEALVACGYDFIELSGYEVFHTEESRWNELVKKFDASGIPCIGFNDYCREVPAIVGNRFDPAAIRSYAQRLLDRGAQAHIKNVGIGSPSARMLPAGYPLERADEQCRRFLEITAEEAAKRNICVLFEAVHDHMCNYANRTADAVQMVRQISSDHVRVVLDFFHMEVMGENWFDTDDFFPLIRHFHFNHWGSGYAREYPGPADLADLRAILKMLHTHGYDGTFSIEAQTLDFSGDAARALAVLRQAEQESRL